MKRLVQPEILDSLPENHPDAAANRRDLRLINSLMGNYRWFCRTLPPLLRRDDRVLELGAGDGKLGLALREACGEKLSSCCGLDFWSRPSDWPAGWDWVQEDLLAFDGYGNFTVLVANLILHQLEDEDLKSLGAAIADSPIRLILANEPARRKMHQWQLKLLRPLGLNRVSRHDGHVSIAGGFRDRELADLLGLSEPLWEVHTRTGLTGGNRMIAIRRGEKIS